MRAERTSGWRLLLGLLCVLPAASAWATGDPVASNMIQGKKVVRFVEKKLGQTEDAATSYRVLKGGVNRSMTIIPLKNGTIKRYVYAGATPERLKQIMTALVGKRTLQTELGGAGLDQIGALPLQDYGLRVFGPKDSTRPLTMVDLKGMKNASLVIDSVRSAKGPQVISAQLAEGGLIVDTIEGKLLQVRSGVLARGL